MVELLEANLPGSLPQDRDLPVYHINLWHHPRLLRWGLSVPFVQTEHTTQLQLIKGMMKGEWREKKPAQKFY